jgi:hypothetical protein
MKWATAIVVALCASAVLAEGTAGSEKEIPPAKRELIRELLEVTEAAEGTADAVLDILAERLGVPPLPDALRGEVRESRHMPDIAERTQLALYDRYFTEQQLRDLIAFFKSDTGRHYVEVSRELAAETRKNLQAEVTRQLEESTQRENIVRARADIQSLGRALEAYRADHKAYPKAGDIDKLSALLSPQYMMIVPKRDRWGRAFAYAVSADGLHYRIIGLGPDGKLEMSSSRFNLAPSEVAYGDDIVYADGVFVHGGTK